MLLTKELLVTHTRFSCGRLVAFDRFAGWGSMEACLVVKIRLLWRRLGITNILELKHNIRFYWSKAEWQYSDFKSIIANRPLSVTISLPKPGRPRTNEVNEILKQRLRPKTWRCLDYGTGTTNKIRWKLDIKGIHRFQTYMPAFRPTTQVNASEFDHLNKGVLLIRSTWLQGEW